MTAHAELVADVIDLANAHGVLHISADPLRSTKGAVDLVLIGISGVAYAEVKSPDGRRTRPQIAFGERVDGAVIAGGYYLWRREHLDSGQVDSVLADLMRPR